MSHLTFCLPASSNHQLIEGQHVSRNGIPARGCVYSATGSHTHPVCWIVKEQLIICFGWLA